MQACVLLNFLRVYLNPKSLLISIYPNENKDEFGIMIDLIIGDTGSQSSVTLFALQPFTDDQKIAALAAGKFLKNVCVICEREILSSTDDTAQTLVKYMLTDRFQKYSPMVVLTEEIIKRVVEALKKNGYADLNPVRAS